MLNCEFSYSCLAQGLTTFSTAVALPTCSFADNHCQVRFGLFRYVIDAYFISHSPNFTATSTSISATTPICIILFPSVLLRSALPYVFSHKSNRVAIGDRVALLSILVLMFAFLRTRRKSRSELAMGSLAIESLPMTYSGLMTSQLGPTFPHQPYHFSVRSQFMLPSFYLRSSRTLITRRQQHDNEPTFRVDPMAVPVPRRGKNTPAVSLLSEHTSISSRYIKSTSASCAISF